MDKLVVEKLLKLTQEGYEKISQPFSETRQYAWRDFNLFTPFVQMSASVLDIGCGTGRVYEFLQKKIGRYVGVDSNKQFIDALKEKYPNNATRQFLQGDMLNLGALGELQGKQFDCIISVAAFHHIPSHALRKKALEEMKVFLKPESTLILLNWNFWRPTLKKKSFWKYNLARIRWSEKQWEQTFGLPKKELGYKDLLTLWTRGKEQTPLYYYSFCTPELARLLKVAGFQVLQNRYILGDTSAHWWNGKNIFTVARIR
ncbi:class I SAM-dependent methyltransferase [Candidatus Uhrbacteria bacterium]|nr:class I SAM-dependent methyltransferase [Candidatus Uhrbacteria bacterium]